MRPLDHCVLPVSDLATARSRLSAMGFTVAPDAVHPFGTENACVFFADGTYLEPLGIAQREDCERTAIKGNQFTYRDQAFRFRNGTDGFSSIALVSQDADGDHNNFSAEGISAGKKLVFGRTMTDPQGNKARATFKLAFAADPRSPDSFAFTCQRLNVPKVDRSALQKHLNTVIGTAEIVASEANPTDFQYFLQTVFKNRETQAHSFGMSIATANSVLDVLTPEGLKAHFGVTRSTLGRGLCFEGIVFTVSDLNAVNNICATNGVVLRKQANRLIADKAAGQGAFFAFQQA